MPLSVGDANCVSNLRYQLKEKLEPFSDEQIAKAWRNFSQSDEYPNLETFVEWIEP